jgi:hypothetical protein
MKKDNNESLDNQIESKLEKESLIHNPHDYKEYSYRFIISILYMLPNISNAMAWITFAPITTIVPKVN